MVEDLQKEPAGALFRQLFAERRRRLLSRTGRRQMGELRKEFAHLFTAEGVRTAFFCLVNVMC